MSEDMNDCHKCDIAHRCGRCDVESKTYMCPISGPYEILEVMQLKGKNETNRDRISKFSTARV